MKRFFCPAALIIILILSGCGRGTDEGYFAVFDKDSKYGFINSDGKTVIDARYDDARSFSEGLAAVCTDGKYGYIDASGNVVIDFLYKEAYDFHDGLACVRDDSDLYGYINKNGDVAIDFQFETRSSFSEGRAAVRLHGQNYGFIDTKGELVIPYSYTGVQSFHDGAALVYNATMDDITYKYIDKDGNDILVPDCVAASSFYNGRAFVKKGSGWVMTDKDGKEYPSKIDNYEFIAPVCDGLMLVKKDGKYGYIDQKGSEVIECEYDYAESFKNSLAFVSNSSDDSAEAFVINKHGKAVYTYPEIKLDSSVGGQDDTGSEPAPELDDDQNNGSDTEE